jgi:Undecaprenyl-phosphate glucose phosphotransferase
MRHHCLRWLRVVGVYCRASSDGKCRAEQLSVTLSNREVGDYVIPTPGEFTPAPLVIRNFEERTTLITAILRRGSTVIAEENRPWRRVARSNWFSPMILAWVIGASDFCLVLLAAAGAFPAYYFAAYYNVVDQDIPGPGRHVLTAFLAAILFVGVFERLGGYRLGQLSKLEWQVTRNLMTWGILISALLFVAFIGKISESYSRGWMLAWMFAAVGTQLAGRCLLEIATRRGRQAGFLAQNIVVFGAGNEGQQLVAKLQRSGDKSVFIRGIFDDRKSRVSRTIHGVSVLGTSDDLLRFARDVRIDDVILALPLDAERRLKTLFEKLKGAALDLRLSVEPIAERFQFHGMRYIGVAPVLEIADRPLKHWRAVVKWFEDQFIAALLLIAFAPLIAIVALLIKLDSRGPVLFVQQRFGFNNEVIPVLKFRTMYVDRGDPSGGQRTVQHDPRITRVGRVIRTLSIDELPQLFNVLHGEMSVVGPRPHPIAMKASDDALYGDAVARYFHRHRVKPGITGWAQVNGLRGEVDTLAKARARVAHDLYYIEHWSLWLDLKILLKTIVVAIYQPAY